MMDFYRDLILDHYKHPRNFGSLVDPDSRVEEGNVACGDRIAMDIKLKNGRKQLEEIRFSGEGCAISMASASLLTEKVKGQQIVDVIKLQTADILEMLGTTLTPSRTKCAVLSLEVLQKAVAQVSKK